MQYIEENHPLDLNSSPNFYISSLVTPLLKMRHAAKISTFYKTNLGSEIINICIYSADCKIATSTNTTFEPDATYQEKEMVFVPYTTLCYSRLLLPFEILNGYIFFKSLDLQPFKISIMSNWRCVNKICTNK